MERHGLITVRDVGSMFCGCDRGRVDSVGQATVDDCRGSSKLLSRKMQVTVEPPGRPTCECLALGKHALFIDQPAPPDCTLVIR